MKGLAQKALVLVVGVVMVWGAGCQEGEVPSTKKARLIAAENIQLKKGLQQRDQEIEKLKDVHHEGIRRQEAELAKCLEQRETLKKQLQENIQERVDEVLTAVVEENAQLRREVGSLKAQIEQLKKQPQAKNTEQEAVEEP